MSRMKPGGALVVTAACLLCTGYAMASGTFAASSAHLAKPMTAEQREEARFLKEAAASARFQAEAARVALGKSSDPNVRTLAASLANQQQAAQVALHQMLRVRSMAPPMLTNDQRRVLNRLAKLRGTAFDRKWMEWVALRSQQRDIQALETATGTLRDPQILGWIARTLPAARWQLASAERVVAHGTRFAKLAPDVLLGPVQPVDVKLTERNTR